MKVVALSDTHGLHEQVDVPDGDILIHAGDMSMNGSKGEIALFLQWYSFLPHEHKILIAGNHDFWMETEKKHFSDAFWNDLGVNYLLNESLDIAGIKFYGSPYTPTFGRWAFMEDEEYLPETWEIIPNNTDVLITHGPPWGILDTTTYYGGVHAGSTSLLNKVADIKPKYHIFGHIHEGYGTFNVEGVQFYNVSICTVEYNPINKPVVFDIKEE